jgi:hypothetical protein
MNAPTADERHATMHEVPEEKRGIYKLQLFDNQKNRKLKQLEHEHRKSDRVRTDHTLRLSVLGDEYKSSTIRIDAAVARKRLIADRVRQARVEKARMLKDAQGETE